jgi:hypothetical protein
MLNGVLNFSFRSHCHCAHPSYLIGSDDHPSATPTQQNAFGGLWLMGGGCYALSYSKSELRIVVVWFKVVSATVGDFVSLINQPRFEPFF